MRKMGKPLIAGGRRGKSCEFVLHVDLSDTDKSCTLLSANQGGAKAPGVTSGTPTRKHWRWISCERTLKRASQTRGNSRNR